MIGQTLGRYRLEASLGRGGMAEVFRARDERLGRTVAVKVILPAFASEPQFGERFLREARLAASLEHPNILPVYDSGEENGVPFLVMPCLDGGTLVDRLQAGPLQPATSRRWIGELAAALDAAHAKGVLHRDVKPANVLLAGGERALLADFGIATAADAGTRLTATGVVIGTPAYMAPELAQGKPASPASDLYALAVLAYEMLTGAPPFAGESALSLLHQHVSTPPPSASARAALPRALDAVFERALAKDPAGRQASCREFAQELATALETGEPVGAATDPTVRSAPTVHLPPATPVAPKKSGRAGWVVAGALLLLVAAIAFWRLLGAPPPPAIGKPENQALTSAQAPLEMPPSATTPPPQSAPPAEPGRSSTARQVEEPSVPAGAAPRPAPPPPAVPTEERAAETPAVDTSADARRPESDLTSAERARWQELQRRAAESPREGLAWFHRQLIADGVPPARAAQLTAAAARRLWGPGVANQVLRQACADGVQEACAELRKRPHRRP